MVLYPKTDQSQVNTRNSHHLQYVSFVLVAQDLLRFSAIGKDQPAVVHQEFAVCIQDFSKYRMPIRQRMRILIQSRDELSVVEANLFGRDSDFLAQIGDGTARA